MKKIMLVTGGSSGIGAMTCKMAKDYHVILCYNNGIERAEKLVDDNIELYKIDISNEEEVINLKKYIENKFGTIDVLVNNAGIAIDTLFEDKTVENFKKTLNVNLIGTFLMSKYIGEIMYNNKKGNIINISSTNGIDTYYPMSIDYDASKAGVISLTKNLAVQYAPYVRVNSVAPGWTMTEMNSNLDEEFINNENKKILLNRFAKPEEIANVILFLASDKSSYINSTVIRVDGGNYLC
jgi:3-oxoacyl-[acyl-carrier protein] reductase